MLQALQKSGLLDPANRSVPADRFSHDDINCSDCLEPIAGVRHPCLPCGGRFNLCSQYFKSTSKPPHEHPGESNTDVQIPQPFVVLEEGVGLQEQEQSQN